MRRLFPYKKSSLRRGGRRQEALTRALSTAQAPAAPGPATASPPAAPAEHAAARAEAEPRDGEGAAEPNGCLNEACTSHGAPIRQPSDEAEPRVDDDGAQSAAQEGMGTAAPTEPPLSSPVSPNGWVLSRRGRSSPANTSRCDTHRASIK
jgi:hypothetical protein